jgi:hypothetical protein
MAQFHFYGSNVDTFEVLQVITEPGDIALTPALNYPTFRAKSFRSVEDGLLEALGKSPLLYVTGPFSLAPVKLRRSASNKSTGRWVINHRCENTINEKYGGPAFTLTIPLSLKRGKEMTRLSPGSLFRQRQFYNEETKQHSPVPDDLRSAYDDVLSRIKKVVKRRTIAGVRIWSGPDAHELLLSRKAIILVAGNWLNADGKVVVSNLRPRPQSS